MWSFTTQACIQERRAGAQIQHGIGPCPLSSVFKKWQWLALGLWPLDLVRPALEVFSAANCEWMA